MRALQGRRVERLALQGGTDEKPRVRQLHARLIKLAQRCGGLCDRRPCAGLELQVLRERCREVGEVGKVTVTRIVPTEGHQLPYRTLAQPVDVHDTYCSSSGRWFQACD